MYNGREVCLKTPILICLLSGLSVGACFGADFPQARISNNSIRATLYLPDPKLGYYRGTRFDWSGVIASLEYGGHNYYGPWFERMDPAVHDFIYEGAGKAVIAGPSSAISGPVEEFGTAAGYEEAKAGGTFVKFGVGVLRKPDDSAYDHYRLYEVADPGKWTVRKKADSIEFTQEVNDPSSGYGYIYRKTVRLVQGKPEMVLEHSLKNTGRKPIDNSCYNHNFLVLDKQPPGPDFTITFPFAIKTDRPPNKDLAEIRGNQIVYLKALAGQDVVQTSVEGFGDTAKDYDITIENRGLGAGMKITADRPLQRASLWSIRTTLSMEPFVKVAVEPGREFTWRISYQYYKIPPGQAKP